MSELVALVLDRNEVNEIAGKYANAEVDEQQADAHRNIVAQYIQVHADQMHEKGHDLHEHGHAEHVAQRIQARLHLDELATESGADQGQREDNGSGHDQTLCGHDLVDTPGHIRARHNLAPLLPHAHYVPGHCHHCLIAAGGGIGRGCRLCLKAARVPQAKTAARFVPGLAQPVVRG